MKILYFSEIREIIGKNEEQIILKKKTNISEIIKLLVSKDENYKKAFESVKNIKCAVNCEYVNSLIFSDNIFFKLITLSSSINKFC